MKQDSFIPLLVAGSVLFLLLISFICAYVIIYIRRQRSNEMEKARLAFEFQKNILNARLEEQERAMTEISKEIHDNVAQKVDFLHMNVKALAETTPRPDQARFINNGKMLLEQIGNELRNISYSLNSDYIKARGLGEVLERELDYIRSARHIACTFHIHGRYESLPPAQELLFYRIAQEALHNTVKYADADNIDVLLSYEPEAVTMRISDNGKGFEAGNLQQEAGLGLKNMQQRAQLMNAAMVIDTAPGAGCSILVTLKR